MSSEKEAKMKEQLKKTNSLRREPEKEKVLKTQQKTVIQIQISASIEGDGYEQTTAKLSKIPNKLGV